MLENSADSLGLSRAQIFALVAVLVVILALLIGFVLLALSAWSNEGSFEAVVQSALISGGALAGLSIPPFLFLGYRPAPPSTRVHNGCASRHQVPP